MPEHPNFQKTQQLMEQVRAGDYSQAFDQYTDDVVVENGPGAGPWRRAENKVELFTMLIEFSQFLQGTFQQDGRCIYADDRVSISVIQETAVAPDGDKFDNCAIYINRFRPDGSVDRLWTVDLDTEHCEEFWLRNPAIPSSSPS